MSAWDEESVWDDPDECEADDAKQFTRICIDEGDHWACGCVVRHARRVMEHWTGTNCTWVDDDITVLGILAQIAIEAGLYKKASLPKTLISDIEKKLAAKACEIPTDDH